MIYTTFDNLQSQQGKPSSIEWGGFCRFIQNVPAYSGKQQQPLIKLGTYQNNSRAQGCELKDVHGIELDYDDGQITPEQAADTLKGTGITAIVCSTYTSTPQQPKWRVFLPLSKPYAAKHRAALVGACDAVLGHVIAPESYTPKQIFFVGRNPDTDYQMINLNGAALDTLSQIQQSARAYIQQQKAEVRATEQVRTETLKRATVERLSPGQVSIIDSFNEAYDVGAILRNHGYVQKGKRYLSPTSQSGLAGVVILNSDGRDRAFSHHGTDPLSNSLANDAFDCFCILEHGSNVNAAIQAAGNMLYMGDVTLSEHNRKAYTAAQAAKTLQQINPDNLKTIGKAARALRNVPGGFEAWQQWAGNRGTKQLWQHLAKQSPLKPGTLYHMAQVELCDMDFMCKPGTLYHMAQGGA